MSGAYLTQILHVNKSTQTTNTATATNPATQQGDVEEDIILQSLYEIRRKIYPRSVTGPFSHARIYLVLLTQLLYYGLPWLNWNGRQAVLFDLVERKFYLFGLVLWPQDVIYLTLLLILSALSLFLFTAIAGRLFCGYACPQTVYTEIFMWIERTIEGDRFARLRLDGEAWPWSLRKWRLKLTKHTLWIVVALWTGFTFIGYFAPIRELGQAVLSWQLGPWQGFWLCFYSFATWGNAGFMREQVCKYMCPYARFQSVMFDQDTLVVTYDKNRGEPRGKRGKQVDYKNQGLGDCVNCSICVQVCPTGIDIRDGLQYMCIGCGACIDACNQVMTQMRYPQGLIRYTSERALNEPTTAHHPIKHLARPRILIYTTIIVALASAFVWSLFARNPVRLDVMRDRGALAREVAGTEIENVYRLQLMNASEKPLNIALEVTGLPDIKLLDPQGESLYHITLAPASNRLLPIKVRIPVEQAHKGTYPIHFFAKATLQAHEATPNDSSIQYQRDEKSSFIVP